MSSTTADQTAEKLRHAINLRLALLGCPTVADAEGAAWTSLAAPIFSRYRETTRQLIDPLSPADHRIQAWLEGYLADIGPSPR